mgnify:CR=1 FL=1
MVHKKGIRRALETEHNYQHLHFSTIQMPLYITSRLRTMTGQLQPLMCSIEGLSEQLLVVPICAWIRPGPISFVLRMAANNLSPAK